MSDERTLKVWRRPIVKNGQRTDRLDRCANKAFLRINQNLIEIILNQWLEFTAMCRILARILGSRDVKTDVFIRLWELADLLQRSINEYVSGVLGNTRTKELMRVT